MERESDAQSYPVNSKTTLAASARGFFKHSACRTEEALPGHGPCQGVRLLALVGFMLLPWLWVGLGLNVIQDYRLTILGYELLGCLLPAMLFGDRPRLVLPLRFCWRWLFFWAMVTALIILGAFKHFHGFQMDWAFFDRQAQNTHLRVDAYFWLFAVWIVILNPILEELFWRGTVYTELRTRLRPAWANLISSVFFGAWHWVVLSHYCRSEWAIILTLAVMVGGLFFAFLYEKTGTLSASVLLHGLGADLPMVFVVYQCIQQGLLHHQGG